MFLSHRQVGKPQSTFSSRFVSGWDARYNTKVPASVLSRELSSSLPMNINALRSLAELVNCRSIFHLSRIEFQPPMFQDFLLEMDFHQYNGTRMEKSVRDKLIKVDASELIQNYGPSRDEREKSRQFIYKEVMKFLAPQKVYFGPTLPYRSEMSDIVFYSNKYLEALDIPGEFRKSLEANVSICRPPNLAVGKDYKWHCIVMPKEQMLSQSGTFNGYLRHKIKHLTRLGYTVNVLKQKKLRYYEKNGALSEEDMLSLLIPY